MPTKIFESTVFVNCSPIFNFILQGLKRMNRNHMHFAAGQPGANGVISGM